MTNYTDRSAEALIARRALAEKATPGPWKQPGRCFVVSIVSKKEPIIGDMKTVADATFIAANDPTTILADIDEILRLRAEVERLKKELMRAQDIAACQHEVAKLAWGGEVPSPLPGHPSMTEDEVCAMFERLNCPWCGGSGHVGDCTEADQAVKGKMERLEKEADWLAQSLESLCSEGGTEVCRGCPLYPDCHMGTESMTKAINIWREAARKAVEPENDRGQA